jgi:quercetin dioxygenase-like cupin family protein
MIKLRACMLALALGACASAGQAPGREPRFVRASEPATADYADGVALALTPAAQEDYSQLRLVERAGYRTPLHVHPNTDETFFVVSGELTVFVGGELRNLGPGDFALIPRGTPHAQGNRTNAETVVVLTMAPGGFEGFFAARAEIVRDTPPGHPEYGPRMMALGELFDIDVLGPSPF